MGRGKSNLYFDHCKLSCVPECQLSFLWTHAVAVVDAVVVGVAGGDRVTSLLNVVGPAQRECSEPGETGVRPPVRGRASPTLPCCRRG